MPITENSKKMGISGIWRKNNRTSNHAFSRRQVVASNSASWCPIVVCPGQQSGIKIDWPNIGGRWYAYGVGNTNVTHAYQRKRILQINTLVVEQGQKHDKQRKEWWCLKYKNWVQNGRNKGSTNFFYMISITGIYHGTEKAGIKNNKLRKTTNSSQQKHTR